MSEKVKYIWVITHYNGDRDVVADIGTYSTYQLAQQASATYIKTNCEDFPLNGEFIHYSKRPIDIWYLDGNKDEES